ncbi:hypothetical protein NPIL_556961 [Nephila pilipes]|uniref:Uncharacterized protein n=1 Tax=Nephila pilipes TaxID=299642 RepID=A0A8X6PBY0_NEPPI|nr:hypothetical protein NPIL_556961 [Nephila pilipes]
MQAKCPEDLQTIPCGGDPDPVEGYHLSSTLLSGAKTYEVRNPASRGLFINDPAEAIDKREWIIASSLITNHYIQFLGHNTCHNRGSAGKRLGIKSLQQQKKSMLSVPIDYAELNGELGNETGQQRVPRNNRGRVRGNGANHPRRDGIAPDVLFSSPSMELIYYNFPTRPQV